MIAQSGSRAAGPPPQDPLYFLFGNEHHDIIVLAQWEAFTGLKTVRVGEPSPTLCLESVDAPWAEACTPAPSACAPARKSHLYGSCPGSDAGSSKASGVRAMLSWPGRWPSDPSRSARFTLARRSIIWCCSS